MGGVPITQRVLQAVSSASASDAIADAQTALYGPLLRWAQGSFLHTGRFGHSVHPALTDLTLGCWTSASILDLTDAEGSRHGAEILVGAGLLAAVPTAIAGAADWAGMTGTDRRIARCTRSAPISPSPATSDRSSRVEVGSTA